MGQTTQYNRPLKLNLDKSAKALAPDEAFYLLNHERNLNGRGTLGKSTPMPANYAACEMDRPAGENYTVGKYKSERTGEMYSWTYNANEVHYIMRMNAAGECEVVYHGCLDLSPEPQHSIEGKLRAYMKIDKICAGQHGKQLIWTNGDGAIGQIDVEASIATNFFTTPFFQRCPDPCAYVRHCVPDPCDCLKGEFVPLTGDQRGKKNNVIDAGFKFSFRHVYYDGRASEWSNPSTLFFLDTKGCFDNSEGFSRCIKLRIPIGNPLVDKIEIAFWKDGVWYLTEVVEKYKKYNSSQQYWYERDLAELEGYSDEDCSFDYYFCNDKQCEVIDPKVMSRVYNPYPRNPQGLMPIGLTDQDAEALAFYNYEQGNCPLDKFEIDKFNIALNCENDDCPVDMVEITVRAVIHNTTHNRNQFIYRIGGSASNSPDDYTDPAWFGGLNPALDGGFETGYDQKFEDKTRNFIFYVEGTPWWGEAKQWKAHAFFTQLEQWGTIANMDDVNTRNRWRRAIRNGEFFYQEAKIKVPRGTKGFIRLASHHATSGSGAFQDTSTFVIGVMTDIHLYHGDMNVLTITDVEPVEEIAFDACNSGNIVIDKAFVIRDNAVDEGGSTKASAYHGYIQDKDGLPVEGAIVGILAPFIFQGMSVTDHNGFYHFYVSPGDTDAIDIEIRVEQDCFNFTNVQTMSVLSSPGSNTRHDQQIDSTTYADDFYANVRMLVKDCNGTGVGGVRVAMSGSKYKITGSDGYVNLRIRNYSTRDRQINAIVLNNNGCLVVDCAGQCHPCMQLSTSSTFPCYMSTPTVNLPDATINTGSYVINRRGLKSGGRYPFSFVVKGDCGYISAAYELGYIDIPRSQEKGKQNFCTMTYDGGGITLPSWAKCIDVLRGENINPFELQWIIDKIERTDDGKIRITIQSLNDYNEKYFFKTNTVYKWLKGDRVEFIKNGDGKIFTIGVYGLLNYLTISPFASEQEGTVPDNNADFFNQLLIHDDGRLDDLTEGAVIELQRSKECSTEPVYYSICTSIPVVDGKLVYDTGSFSTFDTYFVNRTIGKQAAQIFEHHSPSDFWGERLTDAGRAYFANKYENQKRYGRNFTINEPGQFNYYGDRVKKLDPLSHGDIIAAWLNDGRVGLCISEEDNSMFEANNDFVKVGTDGIIRALGGDELVSDSQPKISGQYGCDYAMIGSVFFDDGFVFWWDTNKGNYIKHDYSQAVPIDVGKVNLWFKTQSENIRTSQSVSGALNKLRVCTGKNKHTGALLITVKKLRDGGVNNSYKNFLKPNETILIDPISGDFLTFTSCTPEQYGDLDGAEFAFVSYFGGIPYVHPVFADKWNEFFGIACDWVVGIAINDDPKKIKKGLALEIQDDMMWYVKEVTTDKPGFRSEVPPARMKRNQRGKWNGSFLGNINSRGGLYGDEGPRGYEIKVTLIRDNSQGLIYNSVDNSKRVVYSELDIIATKMMISEQSGMEINV